MHPREPDPPMSEPEAASAGTGPTPEVDGLRWHRSMRGRLVMWTSLSSAGLLLLVTLGTFGAVRAILLDNARAELQALATQTAAGVEARLDSVMIASRTLAESVRAVGVDEDRLKGLLRATVTGDPEVAGAMLILEPGALGPGSPAFHWYVRREGEGFYEQPMRYEGYDYDMTSWWATSAGLNLPWWSDPYANVATGQRWFATFNQPIQAPDGDFAGLVSVDLALDQLQAQLHEADRAGVHAILLSPNGTFAVHPDPELQLRTTLGDLVGRGRGDLEPVMEAVGSRELVRLERDDAPSGERRHELVAPIWAHAWTLVMSTSEEQALARLREATRRLLGGGALAALLSVLLVRLIARRMTTPLMEVADSASHFAAGEFDWPVPHTVRRDEVGLLARAYDRARGSIKAQMTQIGEMTAARQKLESELSIAREIQLAMLPQQGIEHPCAGIHGLLEAAKAVGGDFFSWRMRGDDALWFVVGDVSDKGIPAALFMARTMTVLEIAAERGGSPGKVLAAAAPRLAEHNDTCMFATVLFGSFDLRSGELVLASAGHEPPLLLRAGGLREYLPVEPGGPLGFEPEGSFPEWRGRLLPGDALLVYTDGVTEAFDAGDRAFGSERLEGLPLHGQDAGAICRQVLEAVQAFAGDAPQSDDITVLALFARAPTLQGGD